MAISASKEWFWALFCSTFCRRPTKRTNLGKSPYPKTNTRRQKGWQFGIQYHQREERVIKNGLLNTVQRGCSPTGVLVLAFVKQTSAKYFPYYRNAIAPDLSTSVKKRDGHKKCALFGLQWAIFVFAPGDKFRNKETHRAVKQHYNHILWDFISSQCSQWPLNCLCGEAHLKQKWVSKLNNTGYSANIEQFLRRLHEKKLHCQWLFLHWWLPMTFLKSRRLVELCTYRHGNSPWI